MHVRVVMWVIISLNLRDVIYERPFTSSGQYDAGDIRSWSISFGGLSLDPEVVTTIALKSTQLQIVGTREH